MSSSLLAQITVMFGASVIMVSSIVGVSHAISSHGFSAPLHYDNTPLYSTVTKRCPIFYTLSRHPNPCTALPMAPPTTTLPCSSTLPDLLHHLIICTPIHQNPIPPISAAQCIGMEALLQGVPPPPLQCPAPQFCTTMQSPHTCTPHHTDMDLYPPLSLLLTSLWSSGHG